MSWEVRDMRSATSCFNRGVFRKTVLRFWPIWAIYAFVWLMALPVSIIGQLDARGLDLDYWALRTVGETAHWICPIAACAAAMAAFSHLYSERTANFYAALPVRRGAMFASCAAAGLLPLIAGNLLIALLALCVELAGGGVHFVSLAEWFAAVTLELVAYFGLASLCAMFTGHIVIMPLLFIAANTVAAALGNIALVVPNTFIYGYVISNISWADIFSPFIWILNNVGTMRMQEGVLTTLTELTGWGGLIAYGAFGALLLPLSALCYKRRAMETAGDVVAIAPLRPFFRCLCAVVAALILGDLFFDIVVGYGRGQGSILAALVYSLCMAAGAFIGWFGAEMLLCKSFAVFRGRRFIGWGVISLACAAFVFSCALDVTGFEKRIPAADEVESVYVYTNEGDVDFTEPGDIEAVLALHAEAVESREAGGSVYFSLRYELADGGELKRRYYLDEGDGFVADTLNELMNSPDVILQRKSAPEHIAPSMVTESRVVSRSGAWDVYGYEDNLEYFYFSAEEMAELYNECILPDMREGKIGIVWYGDNEGFGESVYDCEIRIYWGKMNGSRWFSTTPTIWSERTNAWLTEHGVTLLTLAETGAPDPAV